MGGETAWVGWYGAERCVKRPPKTMSTYPCTRRARGCCGSTALTEASIATGLKWGPIEIAPMWNKGMKFGYQRAPKACASHQFRHSKAPKGNANRHELSSGVAVTRTLVVTAYALVEASEGNGVK